MPDVRISKMTDATQTTAKRGYSADKDQLAKRLARIEGQVRGIARMVADDRYCLDVLTQVAAVQAALDGVSLGLLDGHVRHCVADGLTEGDPADEVMATVARLIRRA